MTDEIRPLRWYASLAVVFFGIVPAVMVTLLVLRGNTPGAVGFLLIGGIPLVLAAVWFAFRGLTGPATDDTARLLQRSMALVAGADVILLGGNALIRMATS